MSRSQNIQKLPRPGYFSNDEIKTIAALSFDFSTDQSNDQRIGSRDLFKTGPTVGKVDKL